MLLPITREKQLKGRNAYNRGGYVVMDPDAKPYAAIWAQECYEAMYKLNPINALKVRFSDKARRKMEIMGHEIEVQVAGWLYGLNKDEYRKEEVQRMINGYRGLFGGYTVASLVQMLEARSYSANKWISENKQKIKKMMK